MKSGRSSVKWYEHKGSCVAFNNNILNCLLERRNCGSPPSFIWCRVLESTVVRSPVELVHHKVPFLMKMTLFLTVLDGLLAGRGDRDAEWPYCRFFFFFPQSECPVFVCYLGFSSYLFHRCDLRRPFWKFPITPNLEPSVTGSRAAMTAKPSNMVALGRSGS